MPLPQTPPGGGRGRAYTHVPYVPTDKGHKWKAWIAGPCHWYSCHTSSRTKPCLHDMTGGELLCPLCSTTNIPQVIGYQPLYRGDDGRPVHVIVFEVQREIVDRRKLHEQVWVCRGTEATDTVYLAPILSGGSRYTSTLAERHRPICLDQTLLRMWRLPELTDWYNRTQAPPVPVPVESDNAVSQAAEVKPLTPGLHRWVGIALGEKSEEVVRAAAANAEFVAAAKKGSVNGNGKHHPK